MRLQASSDEMSVAAIIHKANAHNCSGAAGECAWMNGAHRGERNEIKYLTDSKRRCGTLNGLEVSLGKFA